ncbi:MAG: efflux RND transporter periplasmic adaptor subunit, partial [Nitrospira sp.]|nr:efflux RND transporter periplasmic adaptor subunit [Nitrospira sp.]
GMSMDMASMGGQTGSIPVATASVERGSIDATIHYTGSVIPYTQQDIYPRVTGTITEMLVYPGDEVQPGEVLVKLDSVELSSRYNEAKFNVDAAESEVLKAEQELSAAKARLEAVKAEIEIAEAEVEYWQNEIPRAEKLFKNGAISQEEYQRERSEYRSVLARQKHSHDAHEEAQAMVKAAGLNLKKAQAMVQQTKAMQKTAQVIHDYTIIVSPIHGMVSERLISPGVLVNPGMVLLRVVELDKVRVQAHVPTAALQGVKKGNRIVVTSMRNRGVSREAEITSIFPAADPTTRTVVIETVLLNIDRSFLPGDFVSVRISGDHRENVLIVPSRAIVRMDSENATAVWTIEEMSGMQPDQGQGSMKDMPGMGGMEMKDMPGMKQEKSSGSMKDMPGMEGMEMKDMPGMKQEKSSGSMMGMKIARLRRVVTGLSDSKNTEIIKGLEEGDVVIMAGMESLQEGDTVYPTEWTKEGPVELPPPPEMKGMPGMDMSGMGGMSDMKNMSGMKDMPDMDMKDMPGMQKN